MPFRNRREAGRLLAEELARFARPGVIVLALPKGGVPVGYEVAAALHADLDVIVARKIGSPGNRELAIGAVGPDGDVVINESLVRILNVSEAHIASQVSMELKEIARQTKEYRLDRPLPDIKGRIAIIVDDGIATGYTAIAAARYVRSLAPVRTIMAAPVGAGDTVELMKGEVDEVVCLSIPEQFLAVGQAYWDFSPVSDEEVKAMLGLGGDSG